MGLRTLGPWVFWIFLLVRFGNTYFALRGMAGAVHLCGVGEAPGPGSISRCEPNSGKKKKSFTQVKGVVSPPRSFKKATLT